MCHLGSTGVVVGGRAGRDARVGPVGSSGCERKRSDPCDNPLICPFPPASLLDAAWFPGSLPLFNLRKARSSTSDIILSQVSPLSEPDHSSHHETCHRSRSARRHPRCRRRLRLQPATVGRHHAHGERGPRREPTGILRRSQGLPPGHYEGGPRAQPPASVRLQAPGEPAR
jgi:hypothetical protein